MTLKKKHEKNLNGKFKWSCQKCVVKDNRVGSTHWVSRLSAATGTHGSHRDGGRSRNPCQHVGDTKAT